MKTHELLDDKRIAAGMELVLAVAAHMCISLTVEIYCPHISSFFCVEFL